MTAAIASVNPGWGNPAPVQMELDPGIIRDESGVDNVVDLIRTHMEMGGTEFAGVTLFGRMHSHKGLKGYGDVPPKVLAYIEKHAPESLTVATDGWEINTSRLDSWKAYAQDIPPENPDYEWAPSDFVVPSGKGAAARERHKG